MLFCCCSSKQFEERIIVLEQTLAEVELENTNLLNDVLALQVENQQLTAQTASLGCSIDTLIDEVANIDEKNQLKSI